MKGNEPGYVALWRSGELARRAVRARSALTDCKLCAQACGVDRTAHPERGRCRTGVRAAVHGAGPHHGEEAPLRGSRGSGTIFFGGCNLRCVYCQN